MKANLLHYVMLLWMTCCTDYVLATPPRSEQLAPGQLRPPQPLEIWNWPGKSNELNEVIRYLNRTPPIGEGDKGNVTYRIVAMGDSYGAGQGAPDKDGNFNLMPWAPVPPNTAATWDDYSRCRRSNNSGFFKAKTKIVNAFEPAIKVGALSILFKSYACSGAITENILSAEQKKGDPYEGIVFNIPVIDNLLDNVLDQRPIKAQIPQLKNDSTTNEPIDAVLLSIGGNDVGFAPGILACALGKCNSSDLAERYAVQNLEFHKVCLTMTGELTATESRFISTFIDLSATPMSRALACEIIGSIVTAIEVNDMDNGIQKGLTNLSTQYEKIDLELRNLKNNDGQHIAVNNIFITEYPDPFHSSPDGGWCKKIDDPFLSGIDEEEVAWAYNAIYNPLNSYIRDTTQLGWRVIPIEDATKGKGICNNNRIHNINSESLKKQGNDIVPIVPISGGVVHPNNAGYQLTADKIFDEIRPYVESKIRITSDDYPSNTGISIIDRVWKISWMDNTKKELNYKLQILPISQNNPLYEKTVSRNQNQVIYTEQEVNQIKTTFYNEGSFDFRVGVCGYGYVNQSLDWGCFFSDKERFGFSIPEKPVIIGYAKTAPIINGSIGVFYNDPTLKETGIIIAWAKLPITFTDTSDLNSFLHTHDVKFFLLTERDKTLQSHGAPERPPSDSTLGVVLDVIKKHSDETKGSFAFYPYAPNKLPQEYANEKYVVTMKLCNASGCSLWADPIIAKFPVPEKDWSASIRKSQEFYEQMTPEVLDRLFKGLPCTSTESPSQGDRNIPMWSPAGMLIGRPCR